MGINIVLFQPEIPPNTATIGRTCDIVGATLHLIRPLGFSVDQKNFRRAGIDYWDTLDVRYYDSFDEFVQMNNNPKIFMGTTKALHNYCDVKYEKDSYIMFGKESAGIPEEILMEYRDTCIRIPMLEGKRSINLAVSACIVLYEALRQNDFPNLESAGQLHNNSW